MEYKTNYALTIHSKRSKNNCYTCLSILLITSNYRVRGTCGPSTIKRSGKCVINGIFFTTLALTWGGGGRMKFILQQNWSVGIFQITFGQLVYWSEWAKETNLKESD